MAVDVVVHVRLGCPYCETLEKYFLEPLEFMGVLNVRRVFVDLRYDGSNKSLNKIVSYNLSAEGKSENIAPVVFIKNPRRTDSLYDVIAIYETGKDLSVEEEVSVMCMNILHYLRNQYNLRLDDVIENPLIKKVIEWYKSARKKIES